MRRRPHAAGSPSAVLSVSAVSPMKAEKWNPGTGVKGDLDLFKDFPCFSSRRSSWLQKGRLWRRKEMEAGDGQTCRHCSGHGIAIAPTVQSHQQAVPQDLHAWVFWKFQHVDTVEGVKAPWPTQQGNSSFFTKTTAAILITCMLGLKLSKKEMILCTFPSIYYIYM